MGGVLGAINEGERGEGGEKRDEGREMRGDKR